jgi:hypothetical protein
LDAELDGTVRFETVMDDPVKSIGTLAEALGLDVDTPSLDAAASHFRGARGLARPGRSGRASAIVEIVAPDLLLQFDYELTSIAPSVRLAAWTEIAASGAVSAGSNLRRRVQGAVSSRFGVEAWRPFSPPE